MAFVIKSWVDRVVQYPGRRLLTATATPNEYDVTRAEGTVTQAGDAFSASNMNDLENRIKAGFDTLGVPGFFDNGSVGDSLSYWTTDVTNATLQSSSAQWNFQSVAGNIVKIDIFSSVSMTHTPGSGQGFNEFCYFDAESFFDTEMKSAVSSALGFVITNTTMLDARKHGAELTSGVYNPWNTNASIPDYDVAWNALSVGGVAIQDDPITYVIRYEAWIQLS